MGRPKGSKNKKTLLKESQLNSNSVLENTGLTSGNLVSVSDVDQVPAKTKTVTNTLESQKTSGVN